ncbi:MAG TPA: multidrug efflux RND transporter permease subunit [Steroidobacteraceae bacterium]|nr:multidrug efflux RND transporter permease subunit [Steroidobacteraceae bacterium]
MPQFFIDRPVFAWVIALLVMLMGGIALSRLPSDSYPDIAPPQVVISASYPGANASTVETTVTQVIEQQLTSIDNLLYFTAQSSFGQAQITLTFASGTNPDIAAVQTQNRASLADPLLPAEVTQQGIHVNKTSAGFLGVIVLQSGPGGPDPAELNHLVSSRVLDSIERISGVGSANLFGSDFAMRIWLDPDKLHAYGLSAADALNAVKGQNIQIASGSVGAAPAVAGQEMTATVTTEGQFNSVQQFRNILLRTNPNGTSVRLSDVATIGLGSQNYGFATMVNATPVAAFGIQALPNANALAVMKAVNAEMNRLQKTWPPGITWFTPVDQTLFINAAIHDVMFTLVEAIGLVFLVMLIFLQSLRATLIPLLVVPTALLGALIGVYALGYSINQLTLFAMVLAIGIVVDDAIVVVEAVDRIMHEEHLPPKEAARKAMRQISGAIVAITLVLAAVFIPSAMQSGSTGVIYRQFALTIALSMVFSAFFALSWTPSLCATLLRPEHMKANIIFRAFNRAFEGTRAAYVRRVFQSVTHLPRWLLGYAVMLVLGVFLFVRLPGSFVPEEDQSEVMASVELPAGATLHRTQQVLQQVYHIISKNPAAHDVFQVAGSGFGGTSENSGRAYVHLIPWNQRSQTADEFVAWANDALQSKIHNAQVVMTNRPAIRGLGEFSGFDFYLEDRGGLGRAALEQAQDALLAHAANDPVLSEVRVNGLAPQPQLLLTVDRTQAQSMGVSVNDAYTALQLMLAPVFANDFLYDGRVLQVLLQADSRYRMGPDALQHYYLAGGNSTMIPLSNFVHSRWIVASPELTRYDGYPAVEIVGSPQAGYSSGQAMTEMERLVANYLPHGFGFDWAGQSLQELVSAAQAPALFTLSILVVYLALAALYESWSIPASVLFAVPVGLIGSTLATLARGLPNDVYFKVGLITIIGLTAKNAILIVEFAVTEQRNGRSLHNAVLEAARLRFRPIIMTSFAFILGVFPMVVSTGAGANGRHDIGTCVVGGMFTAAVLGVLLIPVCYVGVRRLLGDVLDEPGRSEISPPPATNL